MLNLEIITPRRPSSRMKLTWWKPTGAEGEFGILPGHTQFLTTLEIGEIRYTKERGNDPYRLSQHRFCGGGRRQCHHALDTAELARDIDIERAKQAMERVQEILKTLSYDQAEYRMYELALLKAISRIAVASKKL